MKLASKNKPRLIVYVSPAEMKQAKERAHLAGLQTPHQWLGSIMRIALNSK
jgi:hypothetical protein